MLRQFLDIDGESIHFIAVGQEDSIKEEWTELEISSNPPIPVDPPYETRRSINYPKIGDQLDMLWHMMEDETIPGKGSEWYNSILDVKRQFPKV